MHSETFTDRKEVPMQCSTLRRLAAASLMAGFAFGVHARPAATPDATGGAPVKVDVRTELVRIDAMLQRSMRDTDSGLARSRAARDGTHAHRALRTLLVPQEQSAMRQKRDAVLALAASLSAMTDGPDARRATMPALPIQGAVRVLRADAVGSRCNEPLNLASGQRIDVELPRAGHVWLRLPAGDRGSAVTTRESEIDAMMSRWKECSDVDAPADAVSDDAFGLQADMASPASARGHVVRIDNLGSAGRVSVTHVAGVSVISGRVTAAATGDGLPGIEVNVFEGSNPDTALRVGWGYTNHAGEYEAIIFDTGVTQAMIRTGASETPWVHEAWPNVACRTDSPVQLRSCGPPSPGVISVPLGGDVEGIDIALAEGGVVHGWVRDDQGMPLEHAMVELHDDLWPDARTTSSGPAGRFVFRGLSNGTYRARASANDHASQRYDGLPCTSGDCDIRAGTAILVRAGTPASIDFALDAYVHFRVRVLVGGRPISDTSNFGATVSLTNANGASVYVASTAFDGVARLGPLAPGTYRVRADASSVAYSQLHDGLDCITVACEALLLQATPITVTEEGVAPASIDMDLRPLPRIVGRVTDASTGTPIANVRVIRYTNNNFGDTVYTDGDGRYATRGLQAGSSFLHFVSDTHRDELFDGVPCESNEPLLDCPGATPVTISVGDADRVINRALPRSASISGRVLVNGRAMSGTVRFATIDASGAESYSDRIDVLGNGRYVAHDLPAGMLRVGALDELVYPQINHAVECPTTSPRSFGACPAGGIVHELIGGQTLANMDFNLRHIGSRKGRVTDADTGLPIHGIAIDVWRADGTWVSTSVSDEGGRFAVHHAGTTGPFRMSTDNDLGYRNEVYDDIGCAVGSVFIGTCTLSGGMTFALPDADGPEMQVDLLREIRFGDGFE